MRVLVTGAGGQVGRELAELCVRAGDSVTAEAHFKAWREALAETGKATESLIAAATGSDGRVSFERLHRVLAQPMIALVGADRGQVRAR